MSAPTVTLWSGVHRYVEWKAGDIVVYGPQTFVILGTFKVQGGAVHIRMWRDGLITTW